MLSIIVAAAQNGAIGKDNKLLWHLRNDLQHFKRLTTGHPVIMGRKTFESIGKPLPNRRNIVISRSITALDGFEVVSSLQQALEQCKNDEPFVIGGGQIYVEALPLAQKVYLTLVHVDIAGDTYFPALSPTEWNTVDEQHFEADVQNDHAHSILTLTRI